jgi:hypothetical protein
MKNLTYFMMASLLFTACTGGTQQGDNAEDTVTTEDVTEEAAMQASVTLEEVWATDTVLMTPESVLYHQENDVVYVSNIAGTPPTAEDGDGFISRMNTDGQIIDMRWVEGLDAPKGMGVFGNTLYVTDINELVAIDIENGSISNRYPVEGATFLNDVTVSPDGIVYFTDSDDATIHMLSNDEVSVFMEGDMLNRPNGLYHEPDYLMIASSGDGQVKRVSFADKSLEVLADGVGNGDGIVPDGDGNYLVSNWKGGLYFLSSEWELTQLLDTEDEMNTADIDYIMDENLLLVPTFFDNRVIAYKVNKTAM